MHDYVTEELIAYRLAEHDQEVRQILRETELAGSDEGTEQANPPRPAASRGLRRLFPRVRPLFHAG